MQFSDFISFGAVATVMLAVLGIGTPGSGWRKGAVFVLAVAAYWQIVTGNAQQRMLGDKIADLGRDLESANGALKAAQSDLAEIRKAQEFQKGQLSMLAPHQGTT